MAGQVVFATAAAMKIEEGAMTKLFDAMTRRAGATALVLLLAQPVAPAVIVVEGGCELGDAIAAANGDTAVGGCPAGAGADEIRLRSSISLTSALPPISGSSTVTIRGNGFRVRRAGSAVDFRIFEVLTGGDLTLDNVSVVGGRAVSGAGVSSDGTLTVVNSSFTGNFASGIGGGAIESDGTLTLTSSTLSKNLAVFGGAVDSNGPTEISESLLTGNYAMARGGAIIHFLGPLTITASTLSFNSVIGGPGAPGHNAGGALFVYYGDAQLTNSTVSNNRIAEGNGGGIFNYYGGVTLTNTTVVGNAATDGSALYNYIATTTLENSAINGTCGGFYGVVDGGNNLGCGQGVLTGMDFTLDNNGGPTTTHALNAGSSAIDQAGACAETTDQRGFARVGDCDIGAFEFDAARSLLGGTAVGLDLVSVVCLNQETLSGKGLVSPTSPWDCETGGVSVTLGDGVYQAVGGRALPGADPIAGSMTGMSVFEFVCKNVDSGQEITVQQAGRAVTWDCTAAGFDPMMGERVRVTVFGKVI